MNKSTFVFQLSSFSVGMYSLAHNTGQQCHADLEGVSDPENRYQNLNRTHEKTIAHLPEVHGAAHIEVYLGVNFYNSAH